jgi:uncharacterized protein (DUF983 family)
LGRSIDVPATFVIIGVTAIVNATVLIVVVKMKGSTKKKKAIFSTGLE